ncbi:MAG: HAD-IIIC family phosphatase [Lachnospiraceae bacterium]|nr:HAD-IIIC family phosphatase [Lachnospiraceae bacterium]
MLSFSELKKTSKKNVEGKEYKVAVLSNVASQLFSLGIKGALKAEGINASVFDADYNQIDAQLLDKSSETFAFAPELIVLYISTDKIYEEFLDLDSSLRSIFAENMIKKIESYWDMIARNCSAKVIQPNFTEIDDRAFGNYSSKVDDAFIYQIRKLNFLLEEAMLERKNVYPLDLLSIQIRMGIDQFYDSVLYYSSKMAVSLDAIACISKNVADITKSLRGSFKKGVILDLDNTLWGGVIGDDGLGGIEIGELGSGHAFSDFQRWLKQLKDRGILLCVCSKNNEDTAKEPFEQHEEMVLRLDDFSMFVANWEDKASNIRYIQKNLNIGMDSLVFIDDNPFERNLVREMIPEITVPELPEDPASYLSFLQGENLFETASYSNDDKDRTKQYQAEIKRKNLEQEFVSIDDYLNNLEMIGEAKAFEQVRFARIAQLTQRSNQFNLRTIRYTEADIERIASDNSYITLYYTLKDKFGDHGLVSVVIIKKTSKDEAFVDTWLMSCRVLKRGMEEFIVNKFVEAAKNDGIKILTSEYIKTQKNSMVKDIYKTMGFSEISDGKYSLNVNDYKNKTTYIKEAD